MSRYDSDAPYSTGFAGEEEKPERAAASEWKVREPRHSTEKDTLIDRESKRESDQPAIGSRAMDPLSDPFHVKIDRYDDLDEKSNWMSRVEELDFSTYGWKIHVALARDQRNVQTAWDHVIRPILLKYEIKQFKITKLKNLSKVGSGGKACTIYLYDETRFRLPRFQSGIRACCGRFFSRCNDNIQFVAMLQELEEGLTERGIRAARKPELDRSIHGSQFLSYRNDHGIDDTDPDDPIHYPIEEYKVVKLLTIEDEKQRITDKTNPYGDEDVYGLETIRLRSAAASVMADDKQDEQEAVDLGMK